MAQEWGFQHKIFLSFHYLRRRQNIINHLFDQNGNRARDEENIKSILISHFQNRWQRQGADEIDAFPLSSNIVIQAQNEILIKPIIVDNIMGQENVVSQSS